jgi:outer membrane protein assembly factor BamD
LNNSRLFKTIQTLALLILVVLVAGCHAKFRRIQKNEDWRVKYEASIEYYEKKDYYRAALLFEDIRPNTRGLPEGEKVEFYLAYCQYNEKTYLLAADQFKYFYETYGRSGFAEEAQYMYAYSLYGSAPPANLDQSSGIEAMDAMQTFLNRYPTSKFTDKAVEVITTSQQKLERKGFDNARQYFKIRQYKAAVIALQNFAREYPDSKLLEEASALRVTAQFRLAEQSLTSLQLSRYQSVVEFYQEMIDNFPQSKYLRDVEKFYSESISKINVLKTNNKNS